MLLNDSESSRNMLYSCIENFYKKTNRNIYIFSLPFPESDDAYELCFLLDRKHVVKYRIGKDRGFYLGTVLLAIGPHYFGAADFWSYENWKRFTIEASTEGIEQNLALLDEFLGYPDYQSAELEKILATPVPPLTR
ncbi:MAG: hypothetical protein NWQ13_01240 [Glaciimonas sp.]|nr:hypothetical protein [Glaciimonas sp.]